MKKTLIATIILICAATSAQAQHEPDQIRVGWGGYPLMESLLNVGFGCLCDTPVTYPDLNEIYHDYSKPTFSTGVINVEASWFHRDWFTFSFNVAASYTWEGYRDAVTDKRTGTEDGFILYIVPQARFNWVRRDWVRMYSTVGLGVLAGITEGDFTVLPAAQLTPVGIEVGRRLFGFCEIGAGMLYFGGQAGIGFRF